MAWDLQEAVAYYRRQGAPSDQTALTGLLQEIQQENGGMIPKILLAEAAAALGTKESFLLAIIRRMPRLHLADTHVLELCAGPNCGKAIRLLQLAEQLQKENSGAFTLKQVPCMRMCGKGPNLKWDGKLCHKADEKLLRELIKAE